ncbi:hypothetical protein NQ315_000409 [Exocentrus adspersus]|uniref:Sodefrin-like factor n=1 Tax=Exocentrus adspersus TaxID=1586481 RepID=A0AAV8VMF3_9CUCU|nr:hypothetical protein NQ315_000409 [Exocentrus adspersus]
MVLLFNLRNMSVQDCCYSAVLLLVFVSSGNSLECFNCTATISPGPGDACAGIGSVQKCQDPAVCLSVSYTIEVAVQQVKQYTTHKSCYLKMDGNECETFQKNLKTLLPSDVKLGMGDCFTCEAKGCNEVSLSSEKNKESSAGSLTEKLSVFQKLDVYAR